MSSPSDTFRTFFPQTLRYSSPHPSCIIAAGWMCCWYERSHMWFVFLCVFFGPLTFSWPWLRLHLSPLQASGDTTPKHRSAGMSHAIKNQLILIRDECQTPRTGCARCLFFCVWQKCQRVTAENECGGRQRRCLRSFLLSNVSLVGSPSKQLIPSVRADLMKRGCVEQPADSELIMIRTGVSEETEAKLAGVYCKCELTVQWPGLSDH